MRTQTRAYNEPIGRWKDSLKNDFEASIFPNHPEIEQLKKDMYAAGAMIYASMTGSGSTVFGVFEDAVEHPTWRNFPIDH